MSVVFVDPIPSLESCFATLCRLVAAYEGGASDELKDIRLADAISLVSDLRSRARELDRVRDAAKGRAMIREMWNAVSEWERLNQRNNKETPAALGKAYERAHAASLALEELICGASTPFGEREAAP